ncbi:MAG: hypothetical protein ACQEW5_28035 [Bacillota bacterium]
MSNDSIVLELFGRVQKLEEKVKFLEGKIENQEYPQEEIDEGQPQHNSMTRANSRNYVAERLKQENPDLSIRKANQKEGSGLVMTDDANKQLIIKYYYSKSFLDFPSGWNTVDLSDIESDAFDIYVFNVSYEEKFHVFFFTKEELKSYVSKKRLNSSTKYYFYFQIHPNGKIIETREDENDVSKYYERWNLPSQLV